jgi:isopentenyldiphosphate isomerase
MDEEIIVSPLVNLYENKSYSRKKFYDEQFRGDNPPELAVHVVSVLLFGTNGEIIIQKRSDSKRHNPSLMDKTLGGHMQFGDSDDYAAMVETVQELLVPSVVVSNREDFDKTLNLLKSYIDTIAVAFKKTVRYWVLRRVVEGKTYKLPHIVHFYFGVYGGRMRPADREANGILYYDSLGQLEKELAAHPDVFTDDLKQILKDYREDILEFQEGIRAYFAEKTGRR